MDMSQMKLATENRDPWGGGAALAVQVWWQRLLALSASVRSTAWPSCRDMWLHVCVWPMECRDTLIDACGSKPLHGVCFVRDDVSYGHIERCGFRLGVLAGKRLQGGLWRVLSRLQQQSTNVSDMNACFCRGW